jgi:nanoRNase/pAp phosphatase (c-di-AMP/oligoRNAs hydrolase)
MSIQSPFHPAKRSVTTPWPTGNTGQIPAFSGRMAMPSPFPASFPATGLPNNTERYSSAQFQSDQFQLKRPLPLVRQYGNATHIITFRGLGSLPTDHPPALQFKVRGVTHYQDQGSEGKVRGPINALADSPWQDGQPLRFKTERGQIQLEVPGFGKIGRVPEEISRHLLSLLRQHPDQFRFELSNLVAGNTKGAPTIGMRVNLLYDPSGQGPSQESVSDTPPARRGKQGRKARRAARKSPDFNSSPSLEAKRVFSNVLNDAKCRDVVLPYQPVTAPEDVLKRILQAEQEQHGTAAAQAMQRTVDTITDKLRDPKNRKILLLGHCKPDGDTLGSAIGLKNAIEMMDATRQVDCAVDDRIPGLFRDKIPGISDIKHPNDPEKLEKIEQQLSALRQKLQHPRASQSAERPEMLRSQIRALETEQTILSNPAHLLNPKEKYDLVVTLDIPTPSRFTSRFKPYFERAKEVIYIDHHPLRESEWNAQTQETGLNMAKVKHDGLAWVADSVGACTQLVGILGNRLVPGLTQIAEGKTPSQSLPQASPAESAKHITQYVAGLSTGICTDTSGFTRTANLTPSDMQKPVEQRPDFRPEGMVKWLMQLTDKLPAANRINKKWLRENVTYGISDTAQERMMIHARAGLKHYPDLDFGVVQVDYNGMHDVWQTALATDGSVTLLDVQNEFKYGETMSALKGNNRQQKSAQKKGAAAINEKIAVLICQDRKQGELDEKLQIAPQNGLRLSLRSGDGTNDAELLATLFNGGGHGAAAGARIDLPGVSINTPLTILLNDKPAPNPATVLATLRHNLALIHDRTLSETERQAQLTSIRTIADPDGKPCADILADVIREIRQEKKLRPAKK